MISFSMAQNSKETKKLTTDSKQMCVGRLDEVTAHRRIVENAVKTIMCLQSGKVKER